MTAKKHRMKEVILKDIILGDRFRKDYGDLDDLIESIKEDGVIQPITVTSDLVLVAGGRRCKAALEAGLAKIPALIRDVEDELDLRSLELLENIERKDLTWVEVCRLTGRINDLYKERYGKDWSGRKTADLLGRSHGGVNRQLQLCEAIKAMPELAEQPSSNDAFRILRDLEETFLIKKMREQQEEEIAGLVDGDEEGLDNDKAPGRRQRLSKVQFAKEHYRIGDAFKGLQELGRMYRKQPSPIHLLEVDPPYGIALQDQKKRQSVKGKALTSYHEVEAEVYADWLTDLGSLLYKAAGEDAWCIFWYGPSWSQEVFQALTVAGWSVDPIPAVWVKGEEESEGSGQTGAPNRYLARACEFFYVGRKGEPVLNKQGRSNVFSYKPVPAQTKYHPTQKPVELYCELLRTFGFPGTVICCPFLGSGVTIRASYALDMNCFGWDLNKENLDPFLLSLEEPVITSGG